VLLCRCDIEFRGVPQMKVDGKTGKHAAGELMLGAQGTDCALLVCPMCPERASKKTARASARPSKVLDTVSRLSDQQQRRQLLRVQQSVGDAGSNGGTDKVKLTEINVTIPRTLKAESFSTQHF